MLYIYLSKYLSSRTKALVHYFTAQTGGDGLEGFYFYPGVHAKAYFTESMAFIGSPNLTSSSRSNVEAGITTRSKKVISFLKAAYLELYEKSIRLEKIEMPDNQRSIEDIIKDL